MHPTVKSRLSLPASRWPRALAMAAALTLASGISWLVAGLGETASGWITVGVAMASLIAVCVLFINQAWKVTGGYLYKTLVIVAIMAACITLALSLMAAQWVKMGAIGTRHTATVTSERAVDPWYSRSDDFHYQLAVAGRSLPGELVLGGDDLNPGDVVEVFSAPEIGWHELADDVDSGPDMAVGAGVCYLISLPLGLAAGYFAPMADPTRKRRRSR